MKVSQINNVINYTNRSNASFKGLWGDSFCETYSDREYHHNSTTHTYYPFKNETEKEIKNIVDSHSFYKTSAADVYNAVSQVESAQVRVMTALPFTKIDFKNYLDNTISDLKRIVIEKHILRKNLSMKHL